MSMRGHLCAPAPAAQARPARSTLWGKAGQRCPGPSASMLPLPLHLQGGRWRHLHCSLFAQVGRQPGGPARGAQGAGPHVCREA